MLNEDYGMLYCYPTEMDVEKLWEAARSFLRNTGSNPLMGRMSYSYAKQLGPLVKEINIQYVFADTIRADRFVIAKVEMYNQRHSYIFQLRFLKLGEMGIQILLQTIQM